MYFLNLKGLKEQWKTGTFSQEDSLHYFFGLITNYSFSKVFEKIFSPAGTVTRSVSIGFSTSVVIIAVISIITYLVMRYYFHCNGGKDGNRFLEKLISVYFIWACRIVASVVPVWLIIRLFVSGTSTEFASPLLSFLLLGCVGAFIVFAIYSFYRVGKDLQEIREHEKSKALGLQSAPH